MGKLSLTGVIITIIVFFLGIGFLASRITIDGVAVSTGNMTSQTLLSSMWDGLIDTVGAGLNHIFNPWGW